MTRTRGEIINRRARAGAEVVRARAALEALPRLNVLARTRAHQQLNDALAYYGQCLWDEEAVRPRVLKPSECLK
jgi:hypothetical protein